MKATFTLGKNPYSVYYLKEGDTVDLISIDYGYPDWNASLYKPNEGIIRTYITPLSPEYQKLFQETSPPSYRLPKDDYNVNHHRFSDSYWNTLHTTNIFDIKKQDNLDTPRTQKQDPKHFLHLTEIMGFTISEIAAIFELPKPFISKWKQDWVLTPDILEWGHARLRFLFFDVGIHDTWKPSDKKKLISLLRRKKIGEIRDLFEKDTGVCIKTPLTIEALQESFDA